MTVWHLSTFLRSHLPQVIVPLRVTSLSSARALSTRANITASPRIIVEAILIARTSLGKNNPWLYRDRVYWLALCRARSDSRRGGNWLVASAGAVGPQIDSRCGRLTINLFPARAQSPMDEAIRKAEVLIEALSYIRNFRDRLTVIKLGGSAMEDA